MLSGRLRLGVKTIAFAMVVWSCASINETKATDMNAEEASGVYDGVAIAEQAVTLGDSELEYVECASQGGNCVVSPGTYMAFGGNGKYLFQAARNAVVPCNADTFGGSPATEVTQKCYYASLGLAANHGEPIAFTGLRSVAYGKNGRFVFRTYDSNSGTLYCNGQSFGVDDSGSESGKACYRAVPSFTYQAKEGQTFSLGQEPRPVAYGANGKYAFRLLSGDVSCSNITFGDPLSGTVKNCYVLPMQHKFVALEGSPFTAPPLNCKVLYASGRNGIVLSKWLNSGTCSNQTFGGDPDFLMQKRCYQNCSFTGVGGSGAW